MSNIDDFIRKIATDRGSDILRVSHEDEAARLSEAERLEIRDAERQRQGIEVVRLCGEFATWAADNDIPYDSPSTRAKGWLVGRPMPFWAAPDMSIPTPGKGAVNPLLVREGKGIVGSLGVYADYDVTKAGFLVYNKKDTWANKKANPEDYSAESVAHSIGMLSARHSVEWR